MTNRQATFIIKYKNIGIITGRGIAFYRDDIDMKHPTGGSFMKQKKLVLTGLTVGVVGFSAAFVGCKGSTAAKPLEEGPETGTYYYEDEYGENLLTLSGGQYFTFNYRGENLSGKYKLKDGAITLDFSKKGEEDAVGTLEETVLSFTYNGASVRFLKNVAYKVTFNSNGGSDVAAKNVKNGKTLAKPADPTKAGNKFIGWYKDKDCKGLPFSFETDAITANTDLYALWVAVGENDNEFKINFDLGYEAAAPEAMTTVAGKLYNVAEPTREGYTFKGWWLSSYNDGDKLTAKLTDSTVFDADTTLYAVWAQGDETAPLLSVTQNGAEWEGVTTSAKITIAGPDGLKVTENVGTTAGNRYAYDFAKQAAGDYTVTLEAGGKTATAYYLNGALARVSDLRVVGNAVLMWNPVAGAEKYVVSVKCGNANHEHVEIDNGTSTNFNFVNCAMKEGGIEFTVKALANGKATSVASYTFDRTLAKPENLSYNATTGKLTWNAVREAADYIVTVGKEAYNVGNKTEFSLKGYTGDLEISVVCKTDGYNTSAAATLALTKETPASPANLQINGDNLTWGAVENATGYVVRIGNNEFEVKDPTFNLAEKIDDLNDTSDPTGEYFRVAVKAKFENGESLFSDDIDLRYYAMDRSLKYGKGVLSWTYALGATEYEIKVNNGDSIKSEDNSYEVNLTRAGENLLEVRAIYGTDADTEYATYTVYAYKLTFDAQQGAPVNAVYRAVGDPMDLPVTERDGYDFVGWFNSASAVGVNGKMYDDEYFYGNADYVLYAGWAPKTYNANLNAGDYGEVENETQKVTYTKDYVITPPTIKAEHNDKVFEGWFSSASGTGIQYTDELGNSLRPWNHTDDIPLYARYKDAYKYSLIAGNYEITANPLLAGSKLTELTVPATHDGKTVVSIGEYAFRNFKNLVKVNIPDTVTFIASTAFYDCVRLQTYNVYTPEGQTPVQNPAYETVDGSLIYHNSITGDVELVCVPSVIMGAYKIPYGVTKLNSRNFYKSTISEIVVPASVAEVAKEAFLDCKNLKTLTFEMPEKEQKLAGLAFDPAAISGCTALEVLNLPARLNKITDEAAAFSKLQTLKEINVIGECDGQVYSSLTENDGKYAKGILTNAAGDEIVYCPLKKEFASYKEGENTIYEFDVPNTVTKIAANAFNMNKGLSDKDKVYYSLNEINFHSGMVSIGEKAFYNLRYLRKVTFGTADDPLGLKIGDSAFEGCTYIRELDFGEEANKVSCVKEIGNRAFYGIYLESLVLPGSIEKIGNSAFEACVYLSELDLSKISSTLEFGEYAFARCNSLESVEITDNVGPMEFSSVFYKCAKLREVKASDTNPNFESVDGVLYTKGRETIVYFPSGYTGNFTIDSATKRIGGGVFNGRENVTEITIPASVIEIGENAFEGCANLISVTFLEPASDEQAEPLTVGDAAFYNCTGLTSIELPARTKSIGASAFNQSKAANAKLAEITLNEGLETIGENAFCNAGALTSITIPSTVTEIGARAFYLSALQTVTFAENQNGVTPLTLGNYVFACCSSLKSATLRKGTKNIPAYAFQNDKLLETVTIPSTVTNDNSNGLYAVGVSAFDGCGALNNLVFELGGEAPLSFAQKAFNECTSLEVLNLPKRISPFNGKYDIFQMGDGSALYNANANMAFGTSPEKAVGYGGEKKYPIKEYNVVEDGGDYTSYDGVLYTADKTMVLMCPFGKEGNVEIAKETTTFRPGAFYGCQFITSITFQDGGDADLIIPDGDSGLKGSTNRVFYACWRLATITFPSRIKSIGSFAFYGGGNSTQVKNENGVNVSVKYERTALTEVTFAQNSRLESIGEGAFKTTLITEFTLPESVTEVGANVFADNSTTDKSKLTTLNLSSNVTAEMYFNLTKGVSSLATVNFTSEERLFLIENDVIYDNEKTVIAGVLPNAKTTLTAYEVPATVTKISDEAFKGLSKLKTLTFAEPAEGAAEIKLEIGKYAFSATGITEVTLPKRIENFGAYAFYNCKSLATLKFENGFSASIPDNAFQNSILTEVTIPGDVVAMGRSAFSGTNLTTVTFGLTASGAASQLKSIGADAFNKCTKLALLQVEKTEKDAEGNPTYEENKLPALTSLGVSDSYKNGPFNGCTSLETIVIPDEVTVIGGVAFKGCTSLTSVTLPRALTIIYSEAFSGCTKLKTVKFNDNTETAAVSLQQKVFYGCTALTSIDFTKIGKFEGANIFENCKALTSVNIHEQLDAGIYNALFKGCTALTSATFNPLSGGIGDSTFMNCTKLTTVTIGENVTAIGDSAFESDTALTTVTNNSDLITVIDYKAFKGCTKLKAFRFPAALTEVSGSAFENCTALEAADFSSVMSQEIAIRYAFKNSGIKSVTFGTTPVALSDGAFENCKNLTNVIIPADVTYYKAKTGEPGASAFKGCTNLATVDYRSALAIPKNMFNGCTALTSVTINGNVTEIGAGAFQNCAKLQSIALPAGVTEIADNTFSGCSELATVNFENILTIGTGAFQNCAALTSVEFPAELESIGANAFNGCNRLASVTFNSEPAIGATAFVGCADSLAITTVDGGAMTFENGALYSGTTLVAYYGKATSLTIKDGTTAIAANVFNGNTTLQSVTLPNTVAEIGEKAFYTCTALTTINLRNVKTIGKYAFAGTSKLPMKLAKESADVAGLYIGADTILDYAFQYCTSLTEVAFFGSNVNIGTSAFESCTALKVVTGTTRVAVLKGSAFRKSLQTGVIDLDMSNAEIRGNYVFAEATGLKSVILKGMSTDANGASKKYTNTFDKCTNLESVTVEKAVTMLGDYSFRNCAKLQSFDATELVEVGSYVFENCTGMTNITLTNKLQKMSTGKSLFNKWTSEQTIYLDFEEGQMPSTWNAAWNTGCNAKIVYKKAQATA